MKDVQAAGKAWNPESVSNQTEADFIKDPAHAIEGLNEKENEKALKGVYAECCKAVGKATKEATKA